MLYFTLYMVPTYCRAGVLDPLFLSADGFILKQRSMTAWLLDCPEGWRYIFAAAVMFMNIYTTLKYFANSVKSIFKNQCKYNPFMGRCMHPL